MTSLLLQDVVQSLTISPHESEERYTISGVSWQQYETVLANLADSPWYRVTFLDGVLEILSPSRKHESQKDNIARLLGVYFEETRTRFYGLGSTTFRKALKARGAEPDTCFCIGSEKEFPDLAVEVVETSGGIDKLEVYKGLNVSEVWFWKEGAFELYQLQDDAYVNIATSTLLPDLDLALLSRYVTHPEPLDAMIEFRQQIRDAQS
ncbi:MAG: Uma2 family endonuclease [Leptolyngbyaceae bacterium]|nr:Uma2 family endonuclease [Leptolyngbyaceae bacterium]